MYHHYQQQQPQQGYATTQQPASTTNGMVWNGTAWVPQQQNNTIPPNPVQTFTQYYHEWTAREQQLQQELKTNPSKRQQLQNDAQWAKYYADESSRAAHHFYQNPNATTAPFALPKAPPSLQPKPPPPKQNSNSSTDATGSLTRYLKRNLEHCSTEEEKKAVQAQMEAKIAAAIQSNTLQSKNWDLEPLIKGGGGGQQMQNQQQQAQYQTQQMQHSANNSNQNGGYYGPGSAGTQRSYAAAAGVTAAPSNGSYYGPSGGDNVTTSHNNSQNSNNAYSYYGNSSSLSPSSSSYSPQNSNKRHKKRPGNEDYLALPNIHYKKQRHNQLVRKQGSSDGMDASEEALQKRANRFAATGYVDDSVHNSYTTHDKYMGKGTIGGSNAELDFEQMTVKGTCDILEKEYLRLTAPPRPERVRPLPILQQHLQNLKHEYYKTAQGNDDLLKQRERAPQEQWKEGDSKNRRHDYLWFCSQLKAVRQDCTVQRILGAFAVDVYETHARIALQEGDLNEYNQCQTQLKELYKTAAVPSTTTDDETEKSEETTNATIKAETDDTDKLTTTTSKSSWENEDEFIAYHLLYYVYLSTNEKYSGGSSDMFQILLSLTVEQKQHPAIAHALEIREAVACSDYYRFFRISRTSPNLGTFLTALLVPTMRMRGLRRIVKAYRPSVELTVCLRYLGLLIEDNSGDGDGGATADAASAEQGTAFLTSCGVLVKDGKCLTKDSEVHEPMTGKRNSLI